MFQTQGNLKALWRYRKSFILQTDARTNRGSSGGGVFLKDGFLIGISSFVFQSMDSFSFALPVDWITDLLDKPWTEGTEVAVCKPREVLFHELLDRLTEAPENRVPWEAFSRSWVAAHPEDSEAWFSLGHALYSRLLEVVETNQGETDPGLADAAIAAYRKALALNPGHARSWNNLGAAYDSLGKNAMAVEAFRMAIRINPDYGMAWINLGIAHFNRYAWKEAIEAFRRGLDLVPDNYGAWNSLGFCEAKLHNWDAAINALTVAQRYRPLRVSAWVDLFRAMDSAREETRARSLMAEIEERDHELAQRIQRELGPNDTKKRSVRKPSH